MRLLLDTHAFLWWVFDDARLSPAARDLIADPPAESLFSAVSVWEIAIKARTGRLDLLPDVPEFVADQVRRNRFRVLPVELSHALRVQALPDHHRDPFDRLLVAQAQVEAVPLLSPQAMRRVGLPQEQADTIIERIGNKGIWCNPWRQIRCEIA